MGIASLATPRPTGAARGGNRRYGPFFARADPGHLISPHQLGPEVHPALQIEASWQWISDRHDEDPIVAVPAKPALLVEGDLRTAEPEFRANRLLFAGDPELAKE
jgi:hypothetical protein